MNKGIPIPNVLITGCANRIDVVCNLIHRDGTIDSLFCPSPSIFPGNLPYGTVSYIFYQFNMISMDSSFSSSDNYSNLTLPADGSQIQFLLRDCPNIFQPILFFDYNFSPSMSYLQDGQSTIVSFDVSDYVFLNQSRISWSKSTIMGIREQKQFAELFLMSQTNVLSRTKEILTFGPIDALSDVWAIISLGIAIMSFIFPSKIMIHTYFRIATYGSWLPNFFKLQQQQHINSIEQDGRQQNIEMK